MTPKRMRGISPVHDKPQNLSELVKIKINSSCIMGIDEITKLKKLFIGHDKYK